MTPFHKHIDSVGFMEGMGFSYERAVGRLCLPNDWLWGQEHAMTERPHFRDKTKTQSHARFRTDLREEAC